MSRLLVEGYVVTPRAFVLDGDDLTSLTIDPVFIPKASWPDVVGIMERAQCELQAKIEADAAPVEDPA